jgi:hypothetical protein
VDAEVYETCKDSIDQIEVVKQCNEEPVAIPAPNIIKIEAPLIYKTMNQCVDSHM